MNSLPRALLDRWEPVIGLEVHVQLATRSKLFSPSRAAFGLTANSATDPVVLALPGALPVLNRAAVDMAVRLGLAVGGRIRERCRFARKHYFYPDLPKGFQISQHDEPLVEGGALAYIGQEGPCTVPLMRIHLEEDAGKNIHTAGGYSLVDYNRAGVPLCEVVSAPALHSAGEAAEYLRALRTLVRYLGISDGNMEEGSLRCDANVSLRPRGQTVLGTRTELKNINSFKYVKDAIEHEILRQAAILDGGGQIEQETRLWDPVHGRSQAMRSKEDAHDYRYFPEPDLPPLFVDSDWQASARARLPELPLERHDRYTQALGLSAQDASVLCSEREIGDYFDAVATTLGAAAPPKRAANWVINEILARVPDPRVLASPDLPVSPARLARLVTLVEQGTLSGKLGKEVLSKMWDERLEADVVVAREGLAQVSDVGAIESTCAEVVADHPDEVARFRAGENKLMGFFVGQVLKRSGQKANPKTAGEILRRLLTE